VTQWGLQQCFRSGFEGVAGSFLVVTIDLGCATRQILDPLVQGIDVSNEIESVATTASDNMQTIERAVVIDIGVPTLLLGPFQFGRGVTSGQPLLRRRLFGVGPVWHRPMIVTNLMLLAATATLMIKMQDGR
jgi:hypothetical protein